MSDPQRLARRSASPEFASIPSSLPETVPFVGPEAQERARGRPFAARIGANESLFDPSPAAIRAMQREAASMWQYCDPECHDLRETIAETTGHPRDGIVIGEGIDGLLGLTVRLFVDPGARVVTSAGAYPTFNYHVAGFGGALVTVPYRDDAEDPEALVAAATRERAALVYIANPDNPMGTWHDGTRIEAMIDALPDGAMLCLDEAYIEFAPEGTAPRIAADDPRVIRFRTLSKAHGLAGLRVGYALTAPVIARAFDRIRNHFGVNRMAQSAACAALKDTDHLDHVRSAVAAAREEIGRIGRAVGLTPLPSATNFVALDCGGDGNLARIVLRELLERDVFVRMPGVAPLDRTIRVGCAPAEALDLFEAALGPAIAAAWEGQP